MFDRELSLAVRKRMGDHIATSQCFANAFKAVIWNKDLSSCFYVEGWAAIEREGDDVNPPLYVEHGWIETPDGRIIDPTFAGQAVTVHYFTGLRYDQAERARLFKKAKELPFVWQFHGWGGEDSPEYMAAFNQAREYSRSWQARAG
jgi:hypothetical protein